MCDVHAAHHAGDRAADVVDAKAFKMVFLFLRDLAGCSQQRSVHGWRLSISIESSRSFSAILMTARASFSILPPKTVSLHRFEQFQTVSLQRNNFSRARVDLRTASASKRHTKNGFCLQFLYELC